MTDDVRAEWRRHLTELVRAYQAGGSLERNGRGPIVPTFFLFGSALDTDPPLSTEKQLALSVLLGDPIPLNVLTAACEDAGLFPAGLLAEIESRVRADERERCCRAIDREVGYRSDLKLAPVLRAVAASVKAAVNQPTGGGGE